MHALSYALLLQSQFLHMTIWSRYLILFEVSDPSSRTALLKRTHAIILNVLNSFLRSFVQTNDNSDQVTNLSDVFTSLFHDFFPKKFSLSEQLKTKTNFLNVQKRWLFSQFLIIDIREKFCRFGIRDWWNYLMNSLEDT